jgi:hypothetical protein
MLLLAVFVDVVAHCCPDSHNLKVHSKDCQKGIIFWPFDTFGVRLYVHFSRHKATLLQGTENRSRI